MTIFGLNWARSLYGIIRLLLIASLSWDLGDDQVDEVDRLLLSWVNVWTPVVSKYVLLPSLLRLLTTFLNPVVLIMYLTEDGPGVRLSTRSDNTVSSEEINWVWTEGISIGRLVIFWVLGWHALFPLRILRFVRSCLIRFGCLFWEVGWTSIENSYILE